MEHQMTAVFDDCMGHVDKRNTYHYHLPPTCLINSLGGNVSSSWWLTKQWPARGSASPLLGWALDGWPIYGPYDANGDLMTNATLGRCNGKALPGGGFAYFTTPDGGPSCFVGSPGTATNRGLQMPPRRCPAGGLRSAFCTNLPAAAATCPALQVKPCEKCEKAFFLFPACPKVDETSVTMARVFGVLYTIIFILVAARGPLLWVFELLTGRETSVYLKICRQHDQDWKPCVPQPSSEDPANSDTETLKDQEAKAEEADCVDWLLSKMLGWSPKLLALVREARAFADARVVQAFRAAIVVCVSRLIFMLVDPWHVNELFPALLVGPLYGVVYPSLNWCFLQLIWLLSLRTGIMPSKRPWIVKVPVISNIIEYVVQVIADLIRGFNVAPADNQWLMMCQVYFLAFGLVISFSWFLVIPLVWKNIRTFSKAQQRRFRIELFLITLCAPFKMAHSTFSLLTLLPGDLCGGIPVWAQLLFKEFFVFLEFVTMLTHALVTVYHASL